MARDDRDEAAIAAVNGRIVAAFRDRDAAAAAACYTADGRLMAPGAEPHVGPAAIGASIQAGFATGISGLRLATETLEVLGDTAWEEGVYETFDAAGRSLDLGKYIVIWKRVGGAWLLARDIMSTNRAAKS
ncbi:MAG: DUF4440 domain-containing protein [Geminicoccaceae bacterium]